MFYLFPLTFIYVSVEKQKRNGETVKSLASNKVLFLFVPFL